MEDRWLSVDEIAAYVGVSKETIYRWIDNRGMPSHKVSRFWKFKKKEVDDWIHKGKAADGKK